MEQPEALEHAVVDAGSGRGILPVDASRMESMVLFETQRALSCEPRYSLLRPVTSPAARKPRVGHAFAASQRAPSLLTWGQRRRSACTASRRHQDPRRRR